MKKLKIKMFVLSSIISLIGISTFLTFNIVQSEKNKIDIINDNNFNKIKSLPTTIAPDTYNVSDYILGSQYNNENFPEKEIKDFIFFNYVISGDKPKGFNPSNILLSNVIRTYYNKIIVTVGLNKWINEIGIEVTTGFVPVSITLSGFTPTKFVKTSINVGGSSGWGVIDKIKLADWTEKNSKDFILNNTIEGIKPKNFSENNIIITSTSKDIENNVLELGVALNLYYNEEEKLINNTDNINPDINLKGTIKLQSFYLAPVGGSSSNIGGIIGGVIGGILLIAAIGAGAFWYKTRYLTQKNNDYYDENGGYYDEDGYYVEGNDYYYDENGGYYDEDGYYVDGNGYYDDSNY